MSLKQKQNFWIVKLFSLTSRVKKIWLLSSKENKFSPGSKRKDCKSASRSGWQTRLQRRFFASTLVGFLLASQISSVAVAGRYDCDGNGTLESLYYCSQNVSINLSIVLAPPTGVTADKLGNNSTLVSWTASPHAVSGSVAGYRIYYKLSASGSYANYEIATTTSKIIVNLDDDSDHDFLVLAVGKNGNFSSANCADCEYRSAIQNTGPTDISMSINDLSPTEDVVISLSTYAVGATAMYIFGDLDTDHSDYGENVAEWIPYAGSVTVALTDADGMKDVKIKYRDSSAVESATITKQIILIKATSPSQGGGGGGGGGGVKYIATKTAINAAGVENSNLILPYSIREIVYSVDLRTTQKSTRVTLDVFDLHLDGTIDQRLVEVGYLDEYNIWRAFSNTKLNKNKIHFNIGADRTVIVRTVDAEILTVNSKTPLRTSKPILLPKNTSLLPHKVILVSEDADAKVELPAYTKIRTTNGADYDGIIYAPRLVQKPPSTKNKHISLQSVIVVGSASSDITFDKPVKLTLSVPSDVTNPQIFYCNERVGDYFLVKNAATDKYQSNFSEKERWLTTYVDHLTIYGMSDIKSRAALTLLEAQAEKLYGGGGFGIGIFPDLAPDHWAHDAVSDLWNNYIILGYPDGTFRPDTPVNRAEIVKIALGAFVEGDVNLQAADAAEYGNFPDIETQAWYFPFIRLAHSLGIISGYPDGTFAPERTVNRAEALKILLTASGIPLSTGVHPVFSDVSADVWYDQYAAVAQGYGIVQGYRIKQEPTEKTLLLFETDLIRGDHSDEVRKLQLALSILNFYQGELDGDFHDQTATALYDYQFQNGITNDGLRDSTDHLDGGTRQLLTKLRIFAFTGIASTHYEFRPDSPITRAEVAVLTDNILIAKEKGLEFKSPQAGVSTLITVDIATDGVVGSPSPKSKNRQSGKIRAIKPNPTSDNSANKDSPRQSMPTGYSPDTNQNSSGSAVGLLKNLFRQFWTSQ